MMFVDISDTTIPNLIYVSKMKCYLADDVKMNGIFGNYGSRTIAPGQLPPTNVFQFYI
jgi:hypothetical protein